MWDAREDADRARDGYGLLLLDGALIRRVGYGGRFGAELLADGDLLRPWEFDGEESIGFETGWRVLTRTRLAVLDLPWTERMGRYPRVGPALAGRALVRSRRLAAMMAIAQQPRLDDRLWMLFWELADRHGQVHRRRRPRRPAADPRGAQPPGRRAPAVGVERADEAGRSGAAAAQRARLGAERRPAGVAAGRTSNCAGWEAGAGRGGRARSAGFAAAVLP